MSGALQKWYPTERTKIKCKMIQQANTKSTLSSVYNYSGWIFGTAVLVVGILNFAFVHPVPGLAYVLLSFVYFPTTNVLLKSKTGVVIPIAIKIILAVLLFFFTLGVSDLAEIYGL